MSSNPIPSNPRCSDYGFRRMTAGLVVLSMVALVSMASGCKSLLPFAPQSETSSAQNLSQPSQGKYVIEVRRQGAKPESTTGDLYGQETVSTALAATGITKKRGSWEIELMRTNPQNGTRHRMFIEYDPSERRVPVEQDYALFPNDHLIVKQSTDNPFDELLGNFL